MRILKYAGQTFITSDEMAHALVEMTAQVAKSVDSEAVTVPTIGADGTVVVVDIVLGPASEVISAPIENGWGDFDTTSEVAEIERRTDLLRASRAPKAFPVEDAGPMASYDELSG